MRNFLEAPLRVASIRSWAVLFALVLSVVVSTRAIALAGTEEDARWSIDFGAISISEALDQLTQVTGIKIFTTTPLAHTISPKRYMNQSIEQILKDMLKNLNYAAVWHYSEKGIESIGILAFDRQKAKSPSTVSSVKRAGRRSRPLPRSSEPRRLHPSGQVAGSERKPSVKEPLAEPEETEGGEADEGDEEAVKAPTEEDDTSNLAPSEPQVEPTTDSSNGEEGQANDQQKDGEQSEPSTSVDKEGGQAE
jgi:hypothetical protein